MAGATEELGLGAIPSPGAVEQSGADRGQMTGIRQGNRRDGEEEEGGVSHRDFMDSGNI